METCKQASKIIVVLLIGLIWTNILQAQSNGQYENSKRPGKWIDPKQQNNSESAPVAPVAPVSNAVNEEPVTAAEPVVPAAETVVSSSDLAKLGTITLQGDLFGRSKPDFSGEKDIVSVVPNGTKATILKAEAHNGGYALQVRINEVGSSYGGSDCATIGETTWIYENKAGSLIKNDSNDLKKKLDAMFGVKQKSAEACNGECTGHQLATPSAKKAYAASKATSQYLNKNDQIVPDLWANDPKIENYVNSKKVENMVNFAEENARTSQTHAHGLVYCFHYVKEDLVLNQSKRVSPGVAKIENPGGTATAKPGSMLSSFINETYAKDAGPDLASMGMTDISAEPKYKIMRTQPVLIPKGAVVVYSCDSCPHKGGHIEIKGSNGSGPYYSDYVNQTSYAGEGTAYKITGVFINSKLGPND